MEYFRETIKDYCLEYLDETHTYLVDGVIVPSITQIIRFRNGSKYDTVPSKTLIAARDHGIAVHAAIERWVKEGEESELPELENFKFLMEAYDFQVDYSEIPIILFNSSDEPIAAGRMDLVISNSENTLGIADIKSKKTMTKQDKEDLAYQLNLYRIGFQQSYGEKVEFLRGIQIKGDIRKYIEVPIDEQEAWKLVEEYLNEHSNA